LPPLPPARSSALAALVMGVLALGIPAAVLYSVSAVQRGIEAPRPIRAASLVEDEPTPLEMTHLVAQYNLAWASLETAREPYERRALERQIEAIQRRARQWGYEFRKDTRRGGYVAVSR
jgi:hypothetical protein